MNILHNTASLMVVVLSLMAVHHFQPDIFRPILEMVPRALYPAAQPHYVNTTSFKMSLSEIANLVQLDYTPMYHLSTSINEATSLVRKMKHKSAYALSKTPVSKEFAAEILDFFDEIADELSRTEVIADQANEFYHHQNAQLTTIQHSLRSMRRRILKVNVPGFLDEVEHIIVMIERSVDELVRIKRNLLERQNKMMEQNERANRYIFEVYGERDSAEQAAEKKANGLFGTAVVAGTALAYLVNPVAGIGAAAMSMMMRDGVQGRMEQTMQEFEKAAVVFDETSATLDGCVQGIGMIVNNLNSVKTHLQQIPKGAEKLIYEFGRMEQQAQFTKHDQEELEEMFDFVLSLVNNGKTKYRSNLQLPYDNKA